MRMTTLEKLLVNRPAKGAANVARIRTQLAGLGLTAPLDTLEIGSGAGDVAAALARELDIE
jgi:cyclopropane fatty-acyl-phospholipid synthase-like methyltransferase